MVGYNLRHHSSLKKIKKMIDDKIIGEVLGVSLRCGQFLEDWHADEDYRKRYHVEKKKGGGIILDGIHEIDCALWLLDEPEYLSCFSHKWPHLEMDAENIASIQLAFKSGAIAEIHVDCLQRNYQRACHVIGTKGTLDWDFHEARVTHYSAEDKKWFYFYEGKPFSHCYVEEMRHFLNVLSHHSEERTHFFQGQAKAQYIALLARESSETKRVVSCL